MAGTIRKRSWQTRKGEAKSAWLADYYDQHRERHRKTFATMKAAKSWLVDTSADIKAGVHVPDKGSITVKQATRLWLDRRALRGTERGSLRTYDQYRRLYIEPILGRKELAQLTAPLIEEFADELLRRTSKTRARAVVSALKMVLNDMHRRGLVAVNHALPVRIEDNERDERPVAVGVDIPTKAEIRALLQAAHGAGRARLVTAVFAGLRASEIRAQIRQDDIDFDRRMLSVSKRADWWGAIGKPKSKNGYRDIPMTPLLANTLKEWRLASSPAPDGKSNLIFPGRGGDPINHTSLQASFDEVQRSAGVVDAAGKPKYGLHSLRHFFASWGIEQGFSPKRLQMLLGHGSIRMTYDTCGHLFPSETDDHARLEAAEAALLGAAKLTGG
jgi:integrase